MQRNARQRRFPDGRCYRLDTTPSVSPEQLAQLRGRLASGMSLPQAYRALSQGQPDTFPSEAAFRRAAMRERLAGITR